MSAQRLGGGALLALLSFVLLLESPPAAGKSTLASESLVGSVVEAVDQRAQAAYTAAVQAANDLRVVWEIRALMNSRQAKAAPPASTVPERTTKTCSRG